MLGWCNEVVEAVLIVCFKKATHDTDLGGGFKDCRSLKHTQTKLGGKSFQKLTKFSEKTTSDRGA